jgi:hypothetical protein
MRRRGGGMRRMPQKKRKVATKKVGHFNILVLGKRKERRRGGREEDSNLQLCSPKPCCFAGPVNTFDSSPRQGGEHSCPLLPFLQRKRRTFRVYM